MYDKIQDSLRAWVIEDLKTMTFRMLSREMGINVNDAKAQLATFLSANSSAVHPTWILTGSLIPPQGAQSNMDVDGDDEEGTKVVRMGVLLCTEQDVELKTSLFHPETLSRHVYSLAPGMLRDPSTLIATSTALRSHPNYLRPEIYGTSVSPSITSGPAAKAAKASTSAAVTAPAVKGKGKDTVAAATVPKAKLVAGRLDFSKNQSKEQKDEKKVVDDKAKASLKRKSSPTGGAPKPSTTISVSKPAPDSPPPAAAKTTAKGKSKARVVQSEDEEDAEEEQAPKKAAGGQVKKMTKAEVAAEMASLEGMWDDDDMDVDDNGEDKAKGKCSASPLSAAAPKKKAVLAASESESESPAPAAKPKPSAAAAAKAAPKKKAPIDDDGSDAEDVKPTAKALTSAAAKGSKKKAPAAAGEERRDAQGRLRKTRRVVTTVQGKNKRGYDVMEDVSAEESYYTSEEEDASAAPTRPKPKATTSSTSVSSAGGEGKEKKPMQKVEKKPVGKKPSGQASISSFFGKKSA